MPGGGHVLAEGDGVALTGPWTTASSSPSSAGSNARPERHREAPLDVAPPALGHHRFELRPRSAGIEPAGSWNVMV